MRYFKQFVEYGSYDFNTRKWSPITQIYKRDVSGKMWYWADNQWQVLRFNDARKIYSKAKEIDEKEAFIEIL